MRQGQPTETIIRRCTLSGNAIIAILVALLFPALSKATENSRAAKCTSNLHQLGVAAGLYGNEHENELPIGRADVTGGNGMPTGSRVWYDAMAMYLESQKDATGKLITLPSVFACPSNLAKHKSAATPTADPAFPIRPYTGDYAYNPSFNSYAPIAGGVTRFNQISVPSKRVMILEVSYQNQFDRPTRYPKNQGILGMRHSGADNILWVDLHVSRMTYDQHRGG